MAHLLLQWINEELVLSEHVHSIHQTFKDGFLLAEILHKYNQIADFYRYVRHGSPQSMLDNFVMLQPVMLKIGVRFGSKIASEIMQDNETTTKTVLYEMKICLSSVSRNSKLATTQTLRGTKHDKVLNVVRTSRPVYDRTVSRTFQSAIRGALENTNEAAMSEVLKKYTDRAEGYLRTISLAESMEQGTTMLNRQRAKDIYKSRKEHDGEFDEAWDALNVEQWKRNQGIARERKAIKERVIAKLQLQKQQKIERQRQDSREYTLASMQRFEDTLDNLIVSGDREEEAAGGGGKNSIEFVKTFDVGSMGKTAMF